MYTLLLNIFFLLSLMDVFMMELQLNAIFGHDFNIRIDTCNVLVGWRILSGDHLLHRINYLRQGFFRQGVAKSPEVCMSIVDLLVIKIHS